RRSRSPVTEQQESQIRRRQAGVFGNASQHARADFITIMERENVIRRAGLGKYAMRPGLSFDCPASTQQRRENTLRPTRRPRAHAASKTSAIPGAKAHRFLPGL